MPIYPLLQKALFALEPETAHELSLKSLAAADCLRANRLLPAAHGTPVRLMGLSLPNAVGLAAGLDKNGEYIDALAALGFGFIEIGTVTPRAQDGNPKPRLFRLPEEHAIINRMGFNNHGIDALLENVGKARYSGILGINIGKNAATPIENAAEDYLICLEKAYTRASYITVNISSPNTKNLRDLQAADELNALLGCLNTRRDALSAQHGKRVPLAVKIAPDLDDGQIEAVAAAVRAQHIDAVIATNTTTDKSILGSHPLAGEAGGLSGKPLRAKADAVLQKLAAALNPPAAEKIDIIGVGGIFSKEDAQRKIALGASAVQIYSGLIYQGPALVRACVQALHR